MKQSALKTIAAATEKAAAAEMAAIWLYGACRLHAVRAHCAFIHTFEYMHSFAGAFLLLLLLLIGNGNRQPRIRRNDINFFLFISL